MSTTSETDLVRAIYEVTVDPGAWQRVVDGFNAILPSAKIMLHMDVLKPQQCVAQVSAGLAPETAERHVAYYGSVSPWQASAANLAVGGIAQSTDVIGIDDIVRTEFHADHLRLEEDVRIAYGGVFLRSENSFGALGLQFPYRWIDRDAKAGHRLLQNLLPHLVHATTLAMRNRSLANAAALSTVGLPAIGLDRRGRYVAANGAGQSLLAQGDLAIGVGGMLATRLERKSEILNGAVRRALDREAVVGPLALGRVGDDPLLLSVVPVRKEGPEDPFLDLFDGSGQIAAILLVLDPNGQTASDDLTWLAGAELTSAEIRVCQGVTRGETLKAFSARAGISRNTARNQLAGAMQKLGIARQSDLVALVSGSSH